jgi:ABC-type branched-subunit amino acid transport system ATPase component/branched-subunit amino acid ABC-type transport system permease component
MSVFIPFVIIGITAGSVYGLTGTGLVLTYKTSGIFNFAQGSLAALAVFVFYYLDVDIHMPWPVAASVAVLVLGVLMGLGLELLARLLANASDTIKIGSTVGIMLAVLSLGALWYPSQPQIPSYLPTSTAVRLSGVSVTWEQVIVVLVALVATVALYLFFRFVRLGMAMRGVVDDHDLVAMTGVSPRRVRRAAWIIGSVFAAASGILLAPSLSLQAIVLTELVIQAFGAAAIGYFSSLPLTYIGGLIIGVVAALSTKYVAQVPWLTGLPPSLPFIALFIALIVTPRARLARRRFEPSRALAESWHAPPRVRIVAGAVAVALLSCVPAFAGPNLAVWTAGVIDVILFLSLGLLVRNAGQVSLCQYAFMAVGAAAMGHLTTNMGVPWLLALVISGLIAVPIGAMIAIPAIRLTGVFLALATLGFGIFLEQMFYGESWMFGPNGIAAARPHISIGPINLGSDTGYYYLTVLFATLATMIVLAVQHGRLGRLLRALSDSPLSLETYGASVNVTRVVIFCLSAFLAAVAGGLTASLFHFAVGSNYTSFYSLTLVALLVIITVGDPWYAAIAAFLLAVLPAYLNLGNVTEYLALLFGIGAMLSPIVVQAAPGTPASIRRLVERLWGMQAGTKISVTLSSNGDRMPNTASTASPLRARPSAGATDTAAPERQPAGLEIQSLSVRYGGAAAVVGLDLRAPLGIITGLIGPNGAGKTTTFNACCGLIRPNEGRVLLHDEDVSRLGPAARAQRGLGRTFQRVELFGSLTVRANIEMGLEAGMAGRNPFHQLRARRGERAEITEALECAVEITGVTRLLEHRVAQISTGQRRVVELARVLAGRFNLILLDEPSSGLDPDETQAFGDTLIRAVRERELGILIVEHDMSLVRQVCGHVYVLDFGRVAFEGTPVELLQSAVVREAYLGSESSADLSSPARVVKVDSR